MNILISACLLGVNCRYDGKDNYIDKIEELNKKHHLIPICPEIMGGLSTPRDPAEIRGNQVITKSGNTVTDAFLNGAKESLKLAKLLDCHAAILKERSPSCGSGKVYDGTFSKRLIDGYGMTARLLQENGIQVYGESQLEKLL